jgi:hypothetical protein
MQQFVIAGLTRNPLDSAYFMGLRLEGRNDGFCVLL